MEMKTYTSELLENIRTLSPLVHNITNYVVMNSSANILLALGASPVMAHCRSEIEEMTSMAGALVLNIGTVQEDWLDSMVFAAQIANRRGIPVVLDPVGAGATTLRTEAVKRIMNAADIAVLRGNASEILAVAGVQGSTRGVDSSVDVSETIVQTAREVAVQQNCIVGISGATDIVTDGNTAFRVANGQALMTRVTGMGCGLSAVTAAFCAVSSGDLVPAVAAAFGYYGLCGDLAIQASDLPGSFYVAFLDQLYAVLSNDIAAHLKVYED